MAQTAFILILCNDEKNGRFLEEELRRRHGHSCRIATSLQDALDSIRERVPDVVVASDNIAGEPVVAPLAELLNALGRDSGLLVIGRAERPSGADRIAFETRPEPADLSSLVQPIANQASRAVARRQDRLLKESLEQQPAEAFAGIIGVSPAIRRIIDRIRKAARNKLTVLIAGETGTGKELIARAIHDESPRAKKPFLPLNCAGISETLIESTLFGHVRGAFTGADRDNPGYFVQADGGTLFLDEIGDMPFRMQAKLLRALESREITPVGSAEVRRVDVRVIAATNADLRQRIEDREFRADLLYRLNQWVISVPPLRERRQDIPLLAMHALRSANREHGVNVPGISSEAMNLLTRHHWPGNVRELINVVTRVVCEVENRQMEADDLPEEIRGTHEIVPVSITGLDGLTMEQVERLMIERTLQLTAGNREQAAKMLNIGTRTLYRKIKEYGL
ncbi:MAG: sigma-54-dependent Fis family transcriptional regulator [Phycisphaerae bacterium]|jgi:two-component system response regulator HydG